MQQLCSGVDENAVGSCAQLVFAPIDESFADDAPLLPSGFRVIPLDSKTVSVNIHELNKPFTNIESCNLWILEIIYTRQLILNEHWSLLFLLLILHYFLIVCIFCCRKGMLEIGP